MAHLRNHLNRGQLVSELTSLPTVPQSLSQINLLQSEFSVTRKKSPNVYKSCPKMISLEK